MTMKKRTSEATTVAAAEPTIRTTDLRGITRNADRVRGVVELKFPMRREPNPSSILSDSWIYPREMAWLIFGESSLDAHAKPYRRWSLEARMTHGVTDRERSAAFAFVLPLIGVELEGASLGRVVVHAFVDPHDPDGFHVPRPGYDPTKLPGARVDAKSTQYQGPHIIVPDGYWFPPPDPAHFRAVAGVPVEITFGPAGDEDVG
jgi:hypothetical protein